VVLAALLPDEPRQQAAWALIAALPPEGSLVPALWPSEVGNALLIALRRGRIPEATLPRMLETALDIRVGIELAAPGPIWSEAMALALRHRLTLYDATYLELAQRSALPLATFDQALRDAAAAEGITPLP